MCKICSKKHHTTLHDDSTKVMLNCALVSKKVLLATASLKIKSMDGVRTKIRALIDSGAQAQNKTYVGIQGIGATEKSISSKEIQFEIKQRYASDVRIHGLAYVLKQLIALILNERINADKDQCKNFL